MLEDAVHEALEVLGCVAEAEGHEEVLEQAERRDDRRLGDVLGSRGHQMWREVNTIRARLLLCISG